MKKIFTDSAPAPAGHYSQGIKHNGLLFISGQLPVAPVSGERITGSIEKQTRQALENVRLILENANSSVDSVIKVTVYISDINLWDRVNDVYKVFFGEHKPARVIVPVNKLHYGFDIEIDVVAAINT